MNYYIYGQQGINDEVINHYLKIICEGIKCAKSEEVRRVYSINDMDSGGMAVFYTIMDAFRVLLKKRVKFYIWMQGIYPEERQLRGKGKFDYWLTSEIECKVLKKAEKVFMVSNAMLDHYEKKYHLSLKNKTFIMPCYNCAIEKNNFYVDGKYSIPQFTYVGSLANWQCFDKTIRLFSEIQKVIPDAQLKVFTKEIEKAENVINSFEIKRYSVQYVKASELSKYLKDIKYGFIVRDDISVNNVASPTKISNYLANGIIPIVSDSVHLYKEIAEKYKYIIVGNTMENFIEKIRKYEEYHINADSIYYEYSNIFQDYYNDEKYIKEIASFLQ